MKKSRSFFIWIVSMTLGLMVVLLAAQVMTSRSLSRLESGNEQAAIAFTINNRLEGMVNLSFEIESKLLAEKTPARLANKKSLRDSVDLLKNRLGQLRNLISDNKSFQEPEALLGFTNQLVEISGQVIRNEKNEADVDQLRKLRLGDQIYYQALNFQKNLESILSRNLAENNQVSSRVSWQNRILAFTALIAILILTTIIIRRQVMQHKLISDLEKAREMALQSAKIKDQFLANMSHEIRTPLNALKGFSKLLTKTRLDEEQKQYTHIIDNSSEYLLSIVNDILDFSKLESSNLVLKNKAFCLKEIMQEIELTYASMAEEKNIRFSLELDEQINEELMGDPERLKQVMVNLIGNAIKFTHHGFVQIEVSVIYRSKEYMDIKFAVRDSGIGIPADKHEVIFERFEQIDNNFVRQQGGTGLGLAISRMIVEHMGSRISVKSEPNRGSEFSFTIRFQIHPAHAAVETTPALRSAVNVSDPAKRTVLVAEDNNINRLLLRKILQPYDLDTLYAENGQEVLDMLRHHSVDVILMDVQMPIMDGITATQKIRTELQLNIPIIGMTAYVLPNEIEKCYEAGMNDYLPKPIDEDLFLTALHHYVYLGKSIPKQAIQPDTSANPLIDLSFLIRLCNGNQASVQSILDEMAKQLPIDMAAIREAIREQDSTALKKALHHIRSSASPFGPQSHINLQLIYLTKLVHEDAEWVQLETAALKLDQLLQQMMEHLKPEKV
jgi:signal transduction histidine kinase/ActR/RegA family two-component response regulator